MSDPKSPKGMEFWICRDRNSNMAITREDGIKWADDINGEPASHWIRVIEKSAYDALLLENEKLKASHERLKDICDRNNFRYEQAYDTLLLENKRYQQWCTRKRFKDTKDMDRLKEALAVMKSGLERIGHRNEPEEWSNRDKIVGYLYCFEDVIEDANEALAKADELMKGGKND